MSSPETPAATAKPARPAPRRRSARGPARPSASRGTAEIKNGGIHMPGQVEYWPIERVKPNPRNAMKHTPRAVRRMVNAMLEFGWTRPLQVRGDGDLVVGHRALLAARFLQLRYVPVLRVDHLTPAQTRAYRLADNRLGRDSDWDEPVLLEELRALEREDVDVEMTGFSAEDLADLERSIARASAELDTPRARRSAHPAGRILQMLEFDDQDQKERWLEFTAWLRNRKPGLSLGAALAAHASAAMARRSG